MVTFRNNNNRRNNFRRTDRNFKTNGGQKFTSNFSNNDNFKRKAPGRNNHNAPKLIEKYNDLAREALSNGDKILSENYLQHADHFQRVLNERESFKREKYLENKIDHNIEALQSTLDTDETNFEKETEEVSVKENKDKNFAKTALDNS